MFRTSGANNYILFLEEEIGQNKFKRGSYPLKFANPLPMTTCLTPRVLMPAGREEASEKGEVRHRATAVATAVYTNA